MAVVVTKLGTGWWRGASSTPQHLFRRKRSRCHI